MTDSSASQGVRISIVARETGLTSETLRKWEDRYGFPSPLRDARGVRLYPDWQIERLREIKRLIDTGMRPSRAVDDGQGADTPAPPTAIEDAVSGEVLAALRALDAERLRRVLERELSRRGAAHFLTGTADRLNRLIGDLWARGELQVFHEHLHSSVMQSVLDGIGRKSGNGRSRHPRILLATPPGEQHFLGLAMVGALFADAGAQCLCFGQLPIREIATAVEAGRIDVAGISFSAAFPSRQIQPFLTSLRAAVRADIPIWIGGSGIEKLTRLPAGVLAFPHHDAALVALQRMQAAVPAQA